MPVVAERLRINHAERVLMTLARTGVLLRCLGVVMILLAAERGARDARKA